MQCKLCGGNAGQMPANGAHNLCAALAERGLPTPSLGNKCSACNGTATILRGNGMMLSFDLGPAKIARALNAIKCPTCKGTGIQPV